MSDGQWSGLGMKGTLDPVSFEIIKNSLISVAEEMGFVLRRSSFSPNIKERRDFSCALFDNKGNLIAQAEHIPVHLGAMPYSVQAVLQEFRNDIAEEDCFILNDPFRGGTHLPDITLIQPVFHQDELAGFAANRAHHSDIGGATPGSMSPLAQDIYQEGLRIPPTKLVAKGKMNFEFLDIILSNVRTPRERLGDLRAQQAANRIGTLRLGELFRKFGSRTIQTGMRQLLDYSNRMMLKEISKIPRKSASAEDYLDDDGFETRDIPIRVRVSVSRKSIAFDFTGSAPQTKGPVNAVYSITLSAVYYAVRCITNPDIPANAGCFRSVEVIAPSGTVVNAIPPAAVAGGNVETSQRMVDVVLRAFAGIVPDRVCAACQGTMNNVTIGGTDSRTGGYFTFYETIAGGFGARPNKDGIDGIHSHMTNTLNTPIEAIEASFPLRVKNYSLATGTGGNGKFRGGLGVTREIEFLTDGARISFLGDRQRRGPWGLEGGKPGKPGTYRIIRKGRVKQLPSKGTVPANSGDVFSVTTPGGGGYGDPSDRPSQLIEFDRLD